MILPRGEGMRVCDAFSQVSDTEVKASVKQKLSEQLWRSYWMCFIVLSVNKSQLKQCKASKSVSAY